MHQINLIEKELCSLKHVTVNSMQQYINVNAVVCSVIVVQEYVYSNLSPQHIHLLQIFWLQILCMTVGD